MGTPYEEIGYREPSRAARGVAASGGSEGAPPSNRAPDRCIPDESFQVLWKGIDTLELSFKGSTNPDTAFELQRLKDLAKSRDVAERASAQYVALKQAFRVAEKAWGKSFVLDNHCFRISLAGCAASSIPMASCQIRSEYLAHKGVNAAVSELRVVLTELGVLDGPETVSRVDLAVDFVTEGPLDNWEERGFVTRARNIQAYWKEQFTGWAIGLGSPTVFRLYLKSLEVETVSKKFYLHELWKAGGWPPGYAVWRGEGQLRREVLKERGVQQVEDVLRGLPGLWNYITNEWLRYAIPSNTEATRSRWPIHPVWQSLAAVAWEGDPGPLTRKHTPSGIPTDEYMKRAASGLLTTEMARKGDVDPDRAWLRLKELVLDYFKERGAMPGVSAEALMLDKVAEKGRRYHTMDNTGGPKSKRQEERDYWDSRDYERQSDGW